MTYKFKIALELCTSMRNYDILFFKKLEVIYMLNSNLQKNQLLTSIHKIQYKVEKLIGSGGQGEVYSVTAGGKNYALKWYYQNTASKEQKGIIEKLIKKGSPDKRFLWPQDIIIEKNTFGYIMDLRTPAYKSIVDLMTRRAEPTFKSLCTAGFNLSDCFQKLHSLGYCYSDISFGNAFLNPQNGDVLICDNDNVTANGAKNSSIAGTLGFMAPEVVIGKSDPSTDTDLFSLAVLLFYMFMLHHPLEGEKEAKIKCFDAKAKLKIYGQDPIFIWDPSDSSNRPVSGYQDNAIDYWKIYPDFIKLLFIEAFTAGMRNPSKRVVENQWKKAFIKLRDSIIYCSNCGAENFYNETTATTGSNHICWACNKTIKLPPRIKIANSIIMLNKDSVIYGHHIFDDYNFNDKIAEVTRHPQDPTKWGLQNLGKTTWSLTKPDGTIVPVEREKNAPLLNEMKINFGTVEGILKIN